METVKKSRENLLQGAYDDKLTALYGAAQVANQKVRYATILDNYGRIYGWDRKIEIYTQPYSVALPAGGAGLAMATTLDVAAIVSENHVNVSRLQACNYFGEDNIDLYQCSAYAEEEGMTASLLRGVLVAMRHAGIDVYGCDIYLDSDCLPGSGLNQPEALAALLVSIYAHYFAKEPLSLEQMASIAQWAIVNHYGQLQVEPARLMASLAGGMRFGDGSQAVPASHTATLCVLETGLLAPDGKPLTDQEEKNIAQSLGAPNLAAVSETAFYQALPRLWETVDKQLVLHALGRYTQQNLDEMGGQYPATGLAQPTPTREVERITKPQGGSSKWRNHCNRTYWVVQCAVANDALPAFTAAATEIFGPEKIEQLALRPQGFAQLL